MLKKILLLICSFVLVFSLTSCAERRALDENLHNVIEYVYKEDGITVTGIRYHNDYYHADELGIFSEMTNTYFAHEGDVRLSWNGSRFGYMSSFYSYTTDSPMFIYKLYMTDDCVYFHEAYNYTSDTFVIDGTDAEIVFSDISNFSKLSNPPHLRGDIRIQLYSKNHPRIRMQLKLECIGNQWYLSPAVGSVISWTASDEFINILSENGIINH